MTLSKARTFCRIWTVSLFWLVLPLQSFVSAAADVHTIREVTIIEWMHSERIQLECQINQSLHFCFNLTFFATNKSKDVNKSILMHHEEIASTFLKKMRRRRKQIYLDVSREKYIDISYKMRKKSGKMNTKKQ